MIPGTGREPTSSPKASLSKGIGIDKAGASRGQEAGRIKFSFNGRIIAVPNRDIGCDSVEIGNCSHGREHRRCIQPAQGRAGIRQGAFDPFAPALMSYPSISLASRRLRCVKRRFYRAPSVARMRSKNSRKKPIAPYPSGFTGKCLFLRRSGTRFVCSISIFSVAALSAS
jgi:hypothetical protein